MKNFINPLSIEKQAFRKEKPFVIIDGNGNKIAAFSKLFDAAICLRFVIGKSMSRAECDSAARLLKELDEERNKPSEQSTTETNDPD